MNAGRGREYPAGLQQGRFFEVQLAIAFRRRIELMMALPKPNPQGTASCPTRANQKRASLADNPGSPGGGVAVLASAHFS